MCAKLREAGQKSNLNREMQRDRPLKIYKNALRPRTITNCANTSHQGRARHSTKLLSKVDIFVTATWNSYLVPGDVFQLKTLEISRNDT